MGLGAYHRDFEAMSENKYEEMLEVEKEELKDEEEVVEISHEDDDGGEDVHVVVFEAAVVDHPIVVFFSFVLIKF